MSISFNREDVLVLMERDRNSGSACACQNDDAPAPRKMHRFLLRRGLAGGFDDDVCSLRQEFSNSGRNGIVVNIDDGVGSEPGGDGQPSLSGARHHYCAGTTSPNRRDGQ
nr:hypothetical protein [Brevibacterium linens]